MAILTSGVIRSSQSTECLEQPIQKYKNNIPVLPLSFLHGLLTLNEDTTHNDVGGLG